MRLICQSEAEPCPNQYFCLGADPIPVTQFCSSAEVLSASGPGIYQQNGLQFFDPNLVGEGEFNIEITVALNSYIISVYVYSTIEVEINGQTSSTIQICEGSSVDLYASGASLYTWSPATGLNSTIGEHQIANPLTTTTYSVVGNGPGNCVNQAEVTVVVLSDLVLDITLDNDIICLGQEVTGLATGNENGYNYVISQTPGSFTEISTTGAFSIIQWEEGVYTISAELDNYQCPYTSDEATLLVVEQLPFELSADDNPICVGSSTNLIASSAFDLSYTWSPNAGLSNTTGNSTVASPSISTIYTVTATSESGCSSNENIELVVVQDCCASVFPPPTYLIDANTPDWIGMSYELDQDIIIQAGVNFEINNCVLKFAAGKGIKLLTGADLRILNQSKLTAMDLCDGHWSGIVAFQVANYTSTVDKSLIALESSTIEYADVAVKLYTYYTPGPYSGSNWAHLRLTNDQFLNNRCDLILEGGVASNNWAPILGFASNTNFITDENFRNGFVPNPTKSSIKNISKAFKFIDCSFINTRPDFLLNYEFVAMEYLNSSPYFISYIANNSGIGSNALLSGFTRGIHATSVNGISTNVLLKGADFANWRDVYIRMSGFHRIQENEFYNLQSGLISTSIYVNGGLNYINVESSDLVGTSPYGLYMDGAGGTYSVLDNYFSTSIQLPNFGPYLAHGLIANNTGDYANRIRRNTFENMQRALKIQGDNRMNDYSNGLKYSCNTFINNLSDIRELNSNIGNPASFGVPHQFSSANGNHIDPNNNFTQSSGTCSLCGNDDLSNTTSSSFGDHNYVRQADSQDPHDDETTDAPKVIIIYSVSPKDACVANVQQITGGSAALNAESQKLLAEEYYSDLLEVYLEVLDGGNTDALIDEIHSTNYSGALELYYNLMSKSPNLSEEALVTALMQFELPNVLLANILSSNPHAAKSGRIAEEIEHRPVPFEDYQLAQIEQGLELFSNLEAIQMNLAALLSVRNDALSELMWEIDENDAIPNKADSKMALLDKADYFTDMLLKIDLLCQTGNYTEAKQITEEVEDFFRLTPEDKTDMVALKQLLEIEEFTKLNPGAACSNNQVAQLNAMLTGNSALVSTRALNLLIDRSGYEYIEPVMMDEGGLRNDVSKKKKNFQGSRLRVYPNPAEYLVTIDFAPAGAVTLELYDATGRLCYRQNVNVLATQYLIDLITLPASIYELRLLDSNGRSLGNSSIIKK